MLELSVGDAAPFEISLLGSALTAEISRDPLPDRDLKRHESGDELRVRRDSGLTLIRSHSPVFVVSSNGDEEEIPWFLPLDPLALPRSSRDLLRIGIAGGEDLRRLKMTWKTLAELRARRFPFLSVVLGSCEPPAATDERPHEIHENLDAIDYLASLSRIDIVLECTDGFGPPSYLSVAARDAGIPVVAHVDRPELTRAGNPHSQLWSADGFAEVILDVKRDRVKPADTRRPISRILELIGSE